MQSNTVPLFRKAEDTPTSETKSLPQKYFVSAEIFAQEQQQIFARQWLLVGHQSQIATPGDYFLVSIPSSSGYGAISESLIVIRDKDGGIHGFFNVCRHRGTRLIEVHQGRCAAIQCPYHAWTYGLDGRLIGAPHMDEVSGFDKVDYPLREANLGIWEGFIFVKSEPDRHESEGSASTERDGYKSLEDWFAPLDGKFSSWNMPLLRSAKRIEYDVKANWKLLFENYSECYHCPGVHPQLQKVSPYDSAENDLTEGPFLGGFMRINQGAGLTMTGAACAMGIADFTRAGAPGQNDNNHEHGHAGKNLVFYYSIFPNMLLSLHPEYVMAHQLRPLSPERTLIVCDWFFHPAAFDRKDFKPGDAIEFWDFTNRQDWHMCELSQEGIASRAYEPGPYSSRESIPAAWDQYYLRQMK